MKTLTKNSKNTETRGRKPLAIKLPNRKHFTVDQVVAVQKMPVTPVTVRNRLNELANKGELEVMALPNSGRGHPQYQYTLVA